ncbi:FAD-dependent oxidoreductase [Fodinibius halophilus]|uniref:D-amino-acid oxidase n=1 Tax=Fodinibius halophilus TaxID=1736908 RepID=A0A6M1T674_9BACT|nr:FAD-dependent oxidoreductase [Fodinibius halophilus]NGP88133.1 FAD-binding oxidoreductase [Fodinibius halophilus]
MSEKVIIIGGGVSGLTTGLTLQLLGYKTEIYADKVITDILDKNAHPEFASLFPSASVIPHSVYSDQLEELFHHSQAVFYELRKQTFPGTTINKHYELFETRSDRPDYCDWMLNYQPVEELDTDSIPRRPGNNTLYGWSFNCIFADWSLYLPALYELYQDSGGTITQQKLVSKNIDSLPTDTIINCSGTGSPSLFDDPSEEQLIVRGHLLHKVDAPLLKNSKDETVSYNYTPKASVYSDTKGEASDVYCYPRKDGWILGGSRQTGTLGHTDWDEDKENYEVDGISFPKQIIDLNSEILENRFGASVSLSDDLTPSVGYRYIRNRKNGLRLESETVANRQVIHNYGHGGAGVTLSWGCALKIASLINSVPVDKNKQRLLVEMDH